MSNRNLKDGLQEHEEINHNLTVSLKEEDNKIDFIKKYILKQIQILDNEMN